MILNNSFTVVDKESIFNLLSSNGKSVKSAGLSSIDVNGKIVNLFDRGANLILNKGTIICDNIETYLEIPYKTMKEYICEILVSFCRLKGFEFERKDVSLVKNGNFLVMSCILSKDDSFVVEFSSDFQKYLLDKSSMYYIPKCFDKHVQDKGDCYVVRAFFKCCGEGI